MNFDEQIQKILVAEWDKVKDDIIANYYAKGMKASGDFPNSLEVVYEKRTVSLWGSKYVEQLEYGRRPSSSLPPLQSIFNWIIDKGIMSRAEKEYKIKSLAFVIARKIQREGYSRSNHGGVNLVSEILTDQRIKSIIDLVGKELFGIFEAEITTFFKQI